jgi:hypothetical protein
MNEPTVDCDFPGGSIVVESIDGDTVRLRQDLRDTDRWWFYWHFRVRGAAGRRLRFEFTDGDVLGVRGPAASSDGGARWRWLGREGAAEDATPGFSYAFADGEDDVRFCFAIPYTRADLVQFLEAHAGREGLTRETLCTSRKGRPVDLLRFGRLAGEPAHRVVLTARHHACESIANFVLEGVIEAALAEDDLGRWLRDNVASLAVPIVDGDGVEDGDQGKARRPRDHGRDYAGESLYPETAAIRRVVPEWTYGRRWVAIDLHCPYIRGEWDELIYLVGQRDERIWGEQCRFADVLEAACSRGAAGLPYDAAGKLPFGQAWNTSGNQKDGLGFARWAARQGGIRLASTIEVPYAEAGGAEVTADAARAFGRNLAAALRAYLEPET